MPEPFYHAFYMEYPSPAVLELFTKAKVFTVEDIDFKNGMDVFAVWDTGATISCISPNLAKKLNLQILDTTVIDGVNSSEEADIVTISFGLPNNVVIPDLRVAVCDFTPDAVDILVGMDIIRMGDFMISNGKDKTLFSFAMPPLPVKINLVNQADHINKQ
jgi:hypothetical protein